MNESVRFILNGKPAPSRRIRETPILVGGSVLPSRNLVMGFDSEKAFNAWAQATGYAEKIAEINRAIEAAKKCRKSDLPWVKKVQKRKVSRLEADLKELARRTGLKIGSEALFRRATIDSPPLEGPLFDPVFVFGAINYGDGWMTFGGGLWPVLGWFGWANRIDSVLVSGFALLCSGNWWGGRRLFLTGHPFFGFPDLNAWGWGFDSITNSLVIA